MIPYAIGIPTRDRPKELVMCIKAIINQTMPPDLIVVVDNNTEGMAADTKDTIMDCFNLYGNGTTRIKVVKCDFNTKGPEQGYQTALRRFYDERFSIAVRWDDDLIPELDCMEKLIGHVAEGRAVVAGGMYPVPDEKRTSTLKSAGDGMPIHTQMFRWREGTPLLQAPHLYSSFAYDVRKAMEEGGFCVEYSPAGARGETDFSMRMNRRGGCLIDTSAIAIHHKSSGGVRDIDAAMVDTYVKHDLTLFAHRMLERKLAGDYDKDYKVEIWDG